jgi:NAD+ synthase (glutamine-hydrolysing)
VKIRLAQLNSKIADFDGNLAKISAVLNASATDELVIFPECALCGYPALDLLDHAWFLNGAEKSLETLIQKFPKHSFVMGTIGENRGLGKRLYNEAVFVSEGKVKTRYAKRLLPTYDVFDEDRYFEAGRIPEIIEFQGVKFLLSVCEDAWGRSEDRRIKSRYPQDPLDDASGADWIINISASPFERGKNRLKVMQDQARRTQRGFIHLNAVGANDSIIFGGRSVIFSADGDILFEAPAFQESSWLFDSTQRTSLTPAQIPDETSQVYDALVVGIRDFCLKQGFKTVSLGLSGGIDSAVVACLAVDAVGAENVRLVMLPSRYTSAESNVDAVEIAKATKSPLHILSIEAIFPAVLHTLETTFEGTAPDTTEENIQSRIRGLLLMAISNKTGDLVLACGNKSELATGYCTLYGDMAGGLSPIGDVYKTQVYALGREANKRAKRIPERIFTKEPSAELKANQKDSDSLLTYDRLDPILEALVEKDAKIQDLIAKGFQKEEIEKVVRLLQRTEFKRFQSAPVLKVSSKAFGLGRRFPVVFDGPGQLRFG